MTNKKIYTDQQELREEIKRLTKALTDEKEKSAKYKAKYLSNCKPTVKYNNKMHEIRIVCRDTTLQPVEKVNKIYDLTLK